MFTINLSGSDWTATFETEFKLAMVDSLATLLINLIFILHAQAPVIKVIFNNNIFRIEFVDGRIWKIRILTQSINPEVNYLIPETDKWVRSFIIQYITPIQNTIQELNATFHLSKITIIHL